MNFKVPSGDFYKSEKIKKNLIGQKFGKLTIIEYFGHKKPWYDSWWIAKCDCGNFKIGCKAAFQNRHILKCDSCPKDYKFGRKSAIWKGHEDISLKFFNGLKNKAKQRQIIFDLTINQLWDLFENQNRKCKISNLPLKFQSRTNIKSENDYGTASLDRIDSNKNYEIDNCQWTHKWINLMKLDFTMEEFINMCHLVAKNNPVSIEKLEEFRKSFDK